MKIENFRPPPVSRWHPFDWQYAVDLSHTPMLGPASIIIAIVPLVISSDFTISLLDGSIKISIFVLWLASVSFMCSLAVVHFRCPKFIREYRDFGQYQEMQHSHRWIVWLFYYNLREFSGWQKIVKETLPKGIAIQPDAPIEEAIREKHPLFTELPSKDKVQPFEPVNVDRDIYLPIHCDGKKLVIPMVEKDPEVNPKEKELFWILYSAAAKENHKSRFLFWCLIYISVILVALNITKNILLGIDYVYTKFLPHILS